MANHLCPADPALLTDLYELTMAAAYFDNGIRDEATFELYVRRLPVERGFLVAVGLEQALEYLEALRFTPAQVEFLRAHPAFKHVSRGFFDYLRDFRFSGEVWAVPEGTPIFPMEPMLRVTAPIMEAQLLETFLLTTFTLQTLVATKAARVVQSAGGRAVLEFGSRRAHGPEAGVLAARAAYIGGCAGTSNVEAHQRLGVPSFGTLAHSFIMAYDDELASFRDYTRVFPENDTLLLDTYDVSAAIDKIISAGLRPSGVRLDSGDLARQSKMVRQRLDRAGLTATKIVASGDLDEYSIPHLLAAGGPIDTFGVGTALATSEDAPTLSSVYKLVEFAGRAKVKLAKNKPSYPGRKQIFRSSREGVYVGDVVGLESESLKGEPLLTCVMREGKRNAQPLSLEKIRSYAAECVRQLPSDVRALRHPSKYQVRMSEGVLRLWEEAITPLKHAA